MYVSCMPVGQADLIAKCPDVCFSFSTNSGVSGINTDWVIMRLAEGLDYHAAYRRLKVIHTACLPGQCNSIIIGRSKREIPARLAKHG